jgi:5-methyltetrahydrofolate--homocysteine methyltransferase
MEKNLAKMMMENGGFEVNDLCVDMSLEQFVTAVQESNADFVALPALLTTTMPMMKQTIDALTESGLCDKVKVLIGAAPVTQSLPTISAPTVTQPTPAQLTFWPKNYYSLN